MARQRPNESPAEEPGREISSLKVRKLDAQLVGKIATHRNMSVEKLFQEQDVQDFFTHLLLEEMRKEAERLKGPRKK